MDRTAELLAGTEDDFARAAMAKKVMVQGQQKQDVTCNAGFLRLT
jgi:hypothetical protein